MVWTTVLFGVLLAALGILGYFGSGQTFWPALVPSLLGLSLLAAGLFGFKQTFRKNAMHVAVLAALLGLVGTVHALLELAEVVLRQPGLMIESLTAVVCGVFLWLAIKSFIDARRRRPAIEPPPAETAQEQPSP